MKELKPVLSEGQWERMLTTSDIPELDPDASAALILWTLGWFAWSDAFEHRRVGTLMGEGIAKISNHLAEMQSVKTDPAEFFKLQKQLSNLRNHRTWHLDMANRIAALLPPVPLLERLEKEKENESKGMEAEHREGEGSPPPIG